MSRPDEVLYTECLLNFGHIMRWLWITYLLTYSSMQCVTCRTRVLLFAGLSLGVLVVVVVLAFVTTRMCTQRYRAVKAKEKLKYKMAGCEETVVNFLTNVRDVILMLLQVSVIWSSGSVPNCGMRDARIEFYCGQLYFPWLPLQYTGLGWTAHPYCNA